MVHCVNTLLGNLFPNEIFLQITCHVSEMALQSFLCHLSPRPGIELMSVELHFLEEPFHDTLQSELQWRWLAWDSLYNWRNNVAAHCDKFHIFVWLIYSLRPKILQAHIISLTRVSSESRSKYLSMNSKHQSITVGLTEWAKHQLPFSSLLESFEQDNTEATFGTEALNEWDVKIYVSAETRRS